jgi:hypothetical protein
MSKQGNPETAIQKQIVDALRARGHLVMRMSMGGVKHNGAFKKNPLKGFPDLLVFPANNSGVACAIEVKTATGKLKPEQADWILKLTAKGVVCGVARDVETAIKIVESQDGRQNQDQQCESA